MSRSMFVGSLAAALLAGSGLVNASVPCVCPLWPIESYYDGQGNYFYIYYSESYASDDYECTTPYATYYVDTPDIPWPFICDNCIPAYGPGELGARAFPAEGKTRIAFVGLPEKVAADYSPKFPEKHPEARSGAQIIHEEFAEFTDPETGSAHRVKLFTIKVSPEKAGRRGSERMMGVGYEVVDGEKSTPTIRLPSKYARKQGPKSDDFENAQGTVYRLHVGAMQYTVFLTKPAAESQRPSPQPLPVSSTSARP